MARDTGLTVAELGERLGSREYSEWLAYYRLEPSSYHLQRATLEVLVHLLNAWRTKAATVEDFLPQIERERAAQTPAMQLALLARAFPGGYQIAKPR